MSASILLLAAFKVFWVDPYSSEKYLPDADPVGGVVTNELGLAAARGEIETVSFVVCPDADAVGTDLVPSALTGPDGSTIPASAVDVAVVKAWYRAGGRWQHYWAGDQAHPELANTLVVHDDALVKVDYENKTNYLRLDAKDGPRYADISRRDRSTPFNHDLQPVADAKKFVPMNLKKGVRQQFWVTVKVPLDAKPGDYRGELEIKQSNNQTIEQLSIRLTVYPFALPNPKTHYDSNAPFVSYWMGVPNLEQLLAGGGDLAAAEAKLRTIFRSLKEHNAVNLSGVGTFGGDTTDDLAVRTLVIARQEGLCAKPLINGAAFGDTSFAWNPAGKLRDPAKEPEAYRKTLDDFRAKVVLQNKVLDRYLGHHDCYLSALDECGPVVCRNLFGYWAIAKELGCRIWTDAQPHFDMSFAADLNATAAGVNPHEAGHWHAGGAKVATYAGPFTGAECPDIWRRKGIRYWYADYDGQHEYHFHESVNRWNDFMVAGGKYCQFGIVFLTRDGLVATTAWEGVREGLDDVRYFTLLRRRAEAALKSSDAAVRALGRTALVWQDGIDPERVVDLAAHRRATAAWIVKLIAAVGEEPVERDAELAPPELKPSSVGSDVPSDAAGLRTYVETWRKANRYDLAIPAGEKLLACADVQVGERVKDAVAVSRMLSRQLRRDDAVKTLEGVLARPDCPKSDRGRLLLEKVKAQMTDVVHEEIYTKEQLDAAAAVLKEALQVAGVSEPDRAAAVLRMAEGYLAAKAWQAALGFIDARLADTKLADRNASRLQLARAAALKGLGEWTKACKAYDAARRLGGGGKEYARQANWAEAEAAEKAGDWLRAQNCYAELVPCYESDNGKHHLARAGLDRAMKMAKRNRAAQEPSLDEEGGISLDE